MSKPKLLRRDVPDTFLEDETRPEFKKYQMHKAPIVEWLQTRYPQTANIMHLFFPSDLEKHIEIKKIFNKFDEDKSNALQRNEFMDMMESLMIQVKEKDLKEFYKHVDLDGDDYGRMMREARREFDQSVKKKEEDKKMKELQSKNSLVSFPITSEDIDNYIEQSAKKEEPPVGSITLVHCDSIMIQNKTLEDEIDQEEEELKKKKPPTFPSTFGTLMNHLTYRIRREKLRKQIKKQNHEQIDSAFKNFKELLTLKIEKDTFMNRFNALDRMSEEYQMKKKALGQLFNYVLPVVDVDEEIKDIRSSKPVNEIEELTNDVNEEIKRITNSNFFLKEIKDEPQKYEFVQSPQQEAPPKTASQRSDMMAQSTYSKFTFQKKKPATGTKESVSKKNDAFYLTQYDSGKAEQNPVDIKRTFNVPVTPINPNLAIENNNVNLLTGKTRNRVLVNIKQNTFRDINSRDGSQASMETRESFRNTNENSIRSPSTDFQNIKNYYNMDTLKTDFFEMMNSQNNSSAIDFLKINQPDFSIHKGDKNPKTAYPALRIRDIKTPTSEMESRLSFNKSPSGQFKIRAQTSIGEIRSLTLKPMTATHEQTRKKMNGSKTLAQVLLHPGSATPTNPSTLKNVKLEKLDSFKRGPSGTSSFNIIPTSVAVTESIDGFKESTLKKGYLPVNFQSSVSYKTLTNESPVNRIRSPNNSKPKSFVFPSVIPENEKA